MKKCGSVLPLRLFIRSHFEMLRRAQKDISRAGKAMDEKKKAFLWFYDKMCVKAV